MNAPGGRYRNFVRRTGRQPASIHRRTPVFSFQTVSRTHFSDACSQGNVNTCKHIPTSDPAAEVKGNSPKRDYRNYILYYYNTLKYCLYLFLLTFLFLWSPFATSQPVAPIPEKARDLYQKGLKLLQEKKYDEAIGALETTLKKYPEYGRARLTLAELYLQSGQVEPARQAFLTLCAEDSGLSFRPYWHLARMAHGEEEFETAAHYWGAVVAYPGVPVEIKSEAQKGRADARFALEAIKKPVPFDPIPLGDRVNSSDDEYIPLLNADNSQLIFTRLVGGKQEDLMTADFAEGRPVAAAIPLPPPLNSPANEGGHTMSPDGRRIVFTACNRTDGKGSCDLYRSELTSRGWSVPVNLGAPVNTPHWESQPSLSWDGNTLYFTSKRPGGIGGSDIWMSLRQPGGNWGAPVPLDSGVNTTGDEKYPFVHPDDQTLYFSSTGHPGMGKSDLFMARRGPGGTFRNAINLGYPINTIGDENGLFVARDGRLALMASDRPGGRGRGDLYGFTLPPPSRPLDVSYVGGTVVDSGTGRPLEALVDIIRLADGASVYSSHTLPADGMFLSSLPRPGRYAFQVQKKDYLLYSRHFDLHADTANTRFTIRLSPVVAGREVVLQNVFFAPNSSELDTLSRFELQKLVDFMQSNRSLRLEIQGHTDNLGQDEFNRLLSERRAKSVYEALIALGIEPPRLDYRGYGESRPVDTNDSEGGRSRNRRTSFVVLPAP